MSFSALWTALAVVLFSGINCQITGVGPYGCLTQAGISSLTVCDQLNATQRSCFSDSMATAAIQSCYCKQDVLNMIVDCESEFRLCYLNEQFDNRASVVVSNWHDWCQGYITFQPTTPVLSNPSTTVPTAVVGDQQPFCADYLTTCAMWSISLEACLDIETAATGSAFSQCACSTKLLSLASVCLYDVSRTCFSLNATLDNSLFSICSKTYSNGNILTAPATAVATLTDVSSSPPQTGQSSSVVASQNSADTNSPSRPTTPSTSTASSAMSMLNVSAPTSTNHGSKMKSCHTWMYLVLPMLAL